VGGRVEEGSSGGGGGGGEHVARCGDGEGDWDARSRRRLVYQEMCASRGNEGARCRICPELGRGALNCIVDA